MLTLNDRCDSCFAAAAIKAVNADELFLLFCQHHARQNAAVLKEQGFELEGELDFDLVRS